MSMERLQQIVNDNPDDVTHHVSRILSSIRGSGPYWKQQCEKLMALMIDKGMPTIFFTISAADYQWPDLYRMMPGANSSSESTLAQRVQAVNDNPNIADEFFVQRAESFVKVFLEDCLNAAWTWWRYEWQSRGSIHLHGAARLRDAPDFQQKAREATWGHLAATELAFRYEMPFHYPKAKWLKYRDEEPCVADKTDDELRAMVAAGQAAELVMTTYADKIVSSMHPRGPPPEGQGRPSKHPSSVHYPHAGSKNPKTPSESADKPEQVQYECRFGFTKPVIDSTTVRFRRLGAGVWRTIVETRRNDGRLNNYNPLEIQALRVRIRCASSGYLTSAEQHRYTDSL